VAESCTGSSAACPADAFAPATTICRAAAGPCDVAESCTGSSAACPADAFRPATTICRPAAGPCDVAESCTGTSAACPADAFQPSSTACTPDTDGRACTIPGCDGRGTCDQNHIDNCAAGCLHRSPGFWGEHPEVTALFLPLNSCGLSLNNVNDGVAHSAIEDLCFSGVDARAADTSPQQLQLIRQCTAAALNFVASFQGGGHCDTDVLSNGQTIAQVFDRCCDATSVCTSRASGATIGRAGCIALLDEFNNSADTLDCTTLDPNSDTFKTFCPSLGANGFNANPDACHEANGNGFVNPRLLGPK